MLAALLGSWTVVPPSPSGPLALAKGEALISTEEVTAPNVVLIVSDDQRWDTLWAMPILRSELADHGVTFSNTFVANPVCCPSRATILTGRYSHSTGVYTNHARNEHGGFRAFDDSVTIATALQAAGYRTGLFGKYLNGYKTEYIPPGWDRWFSTFRHGGYYRYTASVDGRLVHYGGERADYGTHVLGHEVVSFIRDTDAARPVFVMYTPHAPHIPAIPARGDAHMFGGLEPSRPPSYDEADVSDKPAFVRLRGRLGSDGVWLDRFRLRQARALVALDRTVGWIVNALADTGRLATTMIVFTSDNGMMWGEHRLSGKGYAFDESIHVPLVVRYDPLTSGARTDDRLVSNADLAPTIADLAGVGLPGAEGMSLVPLLEGTPDVRWREAVLIEHLGEVGGRMAPTFCAVREADFAYVRYVTGERELYDLRRDPFELVNRASTLGRRPVGRRLRAELRALCDPAPPGAPW